MKTLIIYLAFFVWTGALYAQIELEETKVGFAPLSSEIVEDGNSYSFTIRETYQGEFEARPMAFMKENFSMKEFIAVVDKEGKYDGYQVSFRSDKGALQADFDADGNLLSSSERFKNVVLPRDLQKQLYNDHKGWTMVKNIRVTRGNNGGINKTVYRIKLENGAQKKNVKFHGNDLEGSEVVAQ